MDSFPVGTKVFVYNLDRYNNDPHVTEDMLPFLNQTLTIKRLIKSAYKGVCRYKVEENGRTWDSRWLVSVGHEEKFHAV